MTDQVSELQTELRPPFRLSDKVRVWSHRNQNLQDPLSDRAATAAAAAVEFHAAVWQESHLITAASADPVICDEKGQNKMSHP